MRGGNNENTNSSNESINSNHITEGLILHLLRDGPGGLQACGVQAVGDAGAVRRLLQRPQVAKQARRRAAEVALQLPADHSAARLLGGADA